VTLSVRPAEERDIADIVALHELEHVSAYLNPPTADDVRGAFSRPALAQYVIASGDAFEGLLLLTYHDDWMVELHRIAIAQPGRGIGRFAIEWTLNHAFKERKANRVYLEVAARNARARRLYELAGFRYEGTFRQGTRHWETNAFEDLCAYGKLSSD
jgi:RimJ/RimL family protein N-acetyltransferase